MAATETLEDLGRIKLRKDSRIYVCLLPSQANSVVVKYSPSIRISCVMPSFDLKASFQSRGKYSGKKVYKHITIQTPTLIMGLDYGQIPVNFLNTRETGPSYLHALDTSRIDKDIYIKPFKIANVHGDGKVCFGGLAPKNLLQGFSYFWSSGFNQDLSSGDLSEHTKICEKVTHSNYEHKGCNCDGSLKAHTCRCSRKIFHQHRGCGCTAVMKSKACKGKCQDHIEDKDRHRACVCCAALQEHTAKVFFGKARKRDVVNACGCTWRHIRTCSCGYNDCDCVCSCDCCNERCKHPKKCSCYCCRGKCSCPCRCSQMTKFACFIRNYTEKVLPDETWNLSTDTVCGDKYWAAPKGADGVLLTANKSLLAKVPKNFWRKDKNGDAFLVALANRSEDKSAWNFESGGFKLCLKAANVVTNGKMGG